MENTRLKCGNPGKSVEDEIFLRSRRTLSGFVSLILPFCIALFFSSCETKESSGINGGDVKLETSDPASKFPDKVLPCSDEEGENYTGGEFIFLENITYAKELLGDLYLPARGKNFPIAIHIHGGGWVAGSRRTPMGKWWGELFACNGIALFDVEYTLAPKVTIEEQVREIKCALFWTQKEGKEKYGLGDKIIVLGGSAGGHLTAMVSFSKDEIIPSPESCPWVKGESKPPKISASIPFYGVYDLENSGPIRQTRIMRIQGDLNLKRISPINYIGNVDFPVLIIHGQSDSLVPLYYSVELYKKLKEIGVDVELFVVKDAVHAFDSFPENEYTKQTKEKILQFLRSKVFELKSDSSSRFEKLSPQEHIENGKKFLQDGRFKHAYLEFQKSGVNSCETEYGKFLAISFDMISQIINAYQTNLFTLTLETAPPISTQNMRTHIKGYRNSRAKQKQEDENLHWKPNLDLIYDNYIIPIEKRIAKLEELADYIIQNSCTFYVEDGVPIYENIFTAEIRIGRKFGKELAILVKSISEFTKFAFDFIFSHSINFNLYGEKTAKYFVPYFLINGVDDLIGILRTLGIIYEENRNFLSFIRPEKFQRTKDELADSLYYLGEFIEEDLLKPDDSDVLSLKDIDENGTLSRGDRFSVGKIYVKPSDHKSQITALMDIAQTLPLVINKDYVQKVVSKLKELSSKIKSESPINLSELNEFIPDVVRNFLRGIDAIFPDFISVNVGGFLSKNRPLREFLPEAVESNILPDFPFLTGDFPEKLPVFLIEGELGKNAREEYIKPSQSSCYICPPGERFSQYDGMRSVDGKIIQKLEDDCVESQTPFLQGMKRFNIPITTGIYIYFKEPRFAGNVFIKNTGIGCGPEWEGFKEATNFSLNKAINLLILKIDGILSSIPAGIQ